MDVFVDAGEAPEEDMHEFDQVLPRADKDGDGMLTRDELREMIKIRNKANADVALLQVPTAVEDEDDKIDAEVERIFLEKDNNGDGKISREEMMDVFVDAGEAPEEDMHEFDQVLPRADKDGDGMLTRDELREMIKIRNKANADVALLQVPTAVEDDDDKIDAEVERISLEKDNNGDGKISREEMMDVFVDAGEAPEEDMHEFDQLSPRADKDGDGMLTRDELREMIKLHNEAKADVADM